MPVPSTFYKITVSMYNKIGGKHNFPHIHAEYSGEEIVVSLDGLILEGSLPKNKLKLGLKYIWKSLKQIGSSFQALNSTSESTRRNNNYGVVLCYSHVL